MRPLISSKARFALNNPAGRNHITLTRSEAVTIALVLVALPLWIVAGWM
jgi:hypothetical protein